MQVSPVIEPPAIAYIYIIAYIINIVTLICTTHEIFCCYLVILKFMFAEITEIY